MKMGKEHYYNNKILELLIENELITVSFIADKLDITEKTASSYLDSVEMMLSSNNRGIIERKQGVGVWLQATNEQKNEIKNAISNKSISFVQDFEVRVIKIIRNIFLMTRNKPLTLKDLASSMYLSIPTVREAYNEAVKWFDKNEIKVFGVRNKGICIDATESTYRRALKKFILTNPENISLEENLKQLLPGLDIMKVSRILMETEEQWRLEFSESSFNEIWVSLCIAIFRINVADRKLDIEKFKGKAINHNEYAFAQSLFEAIQKQFSIKIEDNEVIYLAEEIICAHFLEGHLNKSCEIGVLEYDLKLRDFTINIVSTISSIIDEDLTNDRILYNNLLQHIGPAIFRLRYRKSGTETTSLGYVKNDYKKVYKAAWATSFLFEEYFDVQVTEEELISITLYIQVAIERNAKPLKAVFVTQTEPGHSQLLCEKIKMFIPQIKEIEVTRVQGLKSSKCLKYDIVLTTVPLPFETDNIILIDLTLSDESVMILRRQVRNIIENKAKREGRLDPQCYGLLDSKLMFTSMKADSKEEIIKFLANSLEENGYVTSGYYKSVMKRESATTTAIGNGVAIPHGFACEINESKVAICTLKEPIPWNDDMVDVIFVPAVKMTTKKESKLIQLFYKYLIKLTATDEMVDILRNITSGAEMYKYLIG